MNTRQLLPRLNRLALAIVVLFSLAGISLTPASPAAANTTTFTGPLQPGYSADPDVVYYNGNYYELYNQGIDSAITIREATSLGLLAGAPNTTVYTADSQTGGNIGWGGFCFHYNNP